MNSQRQNNSNRGRGGNNRSHGNRSYQQQNYRTQIPFGIRGFFVTVEGFQQEKPGVREFYNLFELGHSTDPNAAVPDDSTGEAPDASDELAAACAEAKTQNKAQRGSGNIHLRQIQTSVKNCLFFETDLSVQEVYSITDTIVEKGQERNICRFVARCLPVEITTATETTHLTKDLERMIHSHFVENWKEEKPPTYALEFKARNNEALNRKEVLMILDNLIQGLAPLSRVNLTNPDLSILVNVVQKNVLLSCVRKYQERRKFSTRPPNEENKSNAGAKSKPTNEVESVKEETVVS